MLLSPVKSASPSPSTPSSENMFIDMLFGRDTCSTAATSPIVTSAQSLSSAPASSRPDLPSVSWTTDNIPPLDLSASDVYCVPDAAFPDSKKSTADILKTTSAAPSPMMPYHPSHVPHAYDYDYSRVPSLSPELPALNAYAPSVFFDTNAPELIFSSSSSDASSDDGARSPLLLPVQNSMYAAPPAMPANPMYYPAFPPHAPAVTSQPYDLAGYAATSSPAPHGRLAPTPPTALPPLPSMPPQTRNSGKISKSAASHPKNIPCKHPGCTMMFSRSYNMNQHYDAVHAQLKQHQCSDPFCLKLFTRKHDMHRHMRSVHHQDPS